MQGRVPVTVLRVQGAVDSSTFQGFTAAMRNAIEGGAEYLLLDLAGVPFVSSAGIRSLNEIALLLHKKFADQEKRSSRLKLLNPAERVLETLKISGVDAVFEIHANLENAVASF